MSAITLALITSITASITAFTNQTVALDEQAKSLDISIEKLQLQRNIYKEITGDANNYDSALNNLKGIMSSITLGNGSAYLNILQYLGISTKDLNGNTKELSTIYDELLLVLGDMEDISLKQAKVHHIWNLILLYYH